MIQNGRVETVENRWLALQLFSRHHWAKESPRSPPWPFPARSSTDRLLADADRPISGIFLSRNWDNHFGKNLQPRRIPKLDPSQIVAVWNPNLVRLISVWKTWNPNSWKSSGLLAVSWDWSVWKCSLKLHTVAKRTTVHQKSWNCLFELACLMSTS